MKLSSSSISPSAQFFTLPFSSGAVQGFELHITSNLERRIGQLDNIAKHTPSDTFTRVNMMPWCAYLAFDIISDLPFHAPFGLVSRGRDECELVMPGNAPVSQVPKH